jgi:uncharacterized Zn-binding protein involved in type VI secretion
MPMVVLDGDTSSHGGTVAATTTRSKAEGKLLVRIGDILDCPIHGPSPVVEASEHFKAEGSPFRVARHGDATACGATLISSATRTPID